MHAQRHIREQVWRQNDAEKQARKVVLFKIIEPKHKYKKVVIYVLDFHRKEVEFSGLIKKKSCETSECLGF